MSFFKWLFRPRQPEAIKIYSPSKSDDFLAWAIDKARHRLDNGAFYYDYPRFLYDAMQFDPYGGLDAENKQFLYKRLFHKFGCTEFEMAIIEPFGNEEEMQNLREFLAQAKGMVGHYSDYRKTVFMFTADSDAMLFKMMFG